MRKQVSIVIPLAKKADAHVVLSLKAVRSIAEIIIEEGDNPSKNRNAGIKKSKGEYVAFLNAHSEVSPNWLDNVLRFLSKHKSIDIVGGPQHTHPNESVFGRASGYAMSSPFGSGGIWRRYAGKKEILDADETMLTSANMVCRRGVFKKVMFDENLYPGEDPKFISDARAAGFNVAYYPQAIVFNKRRSTPLSFAKQIFNYGKVRPQKEPFTKTLSRPFFIVPSVFVLYLLSLIFFHPQFYIAPLYLYIALIAISTAISFIKHADFAAAMLMPFIFPIIHVSYGIGMILGMISGRKNGK